MAVNGGKKGRSVTCPHCQTAVGNATLLFEPFQSCCTECGAQLEVSFFPELFNESPLALAGNVVSSEEAACFYHAAKQASEVCDHCGRFLCALCSVDWHQEHLCPDCIQHAGKPGKRRSGSHSRTHYDRLVLGLAVLPALMFWPTLVTAPATLFLVVYFWKRPCSFIETRRRARVRFIVAACFAVLQIAGWTGLGILLATGALS